VRVLIDTTYAERAPFSGTAIYIERLCAALAEADGEVEVVRAANPRRRPPAGGGLGSARNAAADLWWTAVELPRRAAAAGAEVIHHPLPAWAPAARLPQVITVHDLAFERRPEDFDARFRLYAHWTHRLAAGRAAAVVAVSRTTADDVEELWGIAPSRVFVAPHGPGQELTRPAAPTPGDEPRHLLYVGDAEPRKDLSTLLGGYARYRSTATVAALPLVLAGAARAQAPGVRVEPAPGPERLAELYAGAAALVHPARYEGFGLTVLEAMEIGVPVIAAGSPAVVELTAGAAMLFAPGDADALARALETVTGSAPERLRLAAAGRRRAATFSWRESARRHLDAYSWARPR
jgi:glycosyltransferase involved in cell wall biosynthesis